MDMPYIQSVKLAVTTKSMSSSTLADDVRNDAYQSVQSEEYAEYIRMGTADQEDKGHRIDEYEWTDERRSVSD